MENIHGITVFIDTSGIREARVTIIGPDGSVLGKCFMEGKSQTVLPALEKVLADTHRTIDDIIAITVHTGPGSFTGVRVGVAVAKVLSFLLGIDVNNGKPWKNIDILYEKDKFAASPLQG